MNILSKINPNHLSLIRIILTPVFLLFILLPDRWGFAIALALFVLASVTDYLDGYIARKYNKITDLGKFLDPLADKVLVFAGLLAMIYYIHNILVVFLVFIIIIREIAVTGLRAVAASKGIVMPADKLGKYKTVAQILLIIGFLLSLDFNVIMILLIISAILTVVSGAEYFIRAGQVLKD